MTMPVQAQPSPDPAVLRLQHDLNRLRRQYPFLPLLETSGRYDPATQRAVMRFQQELYPPVTGAADPGTLEAVRQAVLDLEGYDPNPRVLRGFPAAGNALPDTLHSYMKVPQAMFQALLPLMEGIQPDIADGHHGAASVANVRWLQRRAGLTETGIMEMQTWNALTQLYELMVIADPELLIPGRG